MWWVPFISEPFEEFRSELVFLARSCWRWNVNSWIMFIVMRSVFFCFRFYFLSFFLSFFLVWFVSFLFSCSSRSPLLKFDLAWRFHLLYLFIYILLISFLFENDLLSFSFPFVLLVFFSFALDGVGRGTQSRRGNWIMRWLNCISRSWSGQGGGGGHGFDAESEDSLARDGRCEAGAGLTDGIRPLRQLMASLWYFFLIACDISTVLERGRFECVESGCVINDERPSAGGLRVGWSDRHGVICIWMVLSSRWIDCGIRSACMIRAQLVELNYKSSQLIMIPR